MPNLALVETKRIAMQFALAMSLFYLSFDLISGCTVLYAQFDAKLDYDYKLSVTVRPKRDE
jgi:hypothetical protein